MSRKNEVAQVRLTKVEVLRESIKIIIGALSEKSVPITQVGSRAFVEWHPVTGKPKRINIPYVPDNASDRLIKAVQGFVDHECAHVLFTDFNCVKLAIKSGAGMVGNILEDTHIERKMKALYSGSRHNLIEVWGFLAEEMLKEPLDDAIAEGHRAKIVATGLPIAIHAWAGNEAAVDFMDTRWAAFKDIKRIIGDDIIDEIPNIKSSKDGLLLAVAMKNRLIEWKEKEEREEKERREKERDEREKETKGEGDPDPEGGFSDPDMDDVLDPDEDDDDDGSSGDPMDDEDGDPVEGDDDCDPGEGGDEEDDYDPDDEDFRPPDPRSEDDDDDFEDDSETEDSSGDDDEEGDEPEEGKDEDFESTFDPETHNPEDSEDGEASPPDSDGEREEEEEEEGGDGGLSGSDSDDTPTENDEEKLDEDKEHGKTSPEGAPPEKEEEEEEEEIDMSDFESEAEEILEAMDDMEDIEGVANELIAEEMDAALSSTDYWPLTKDADIIERYTPKRVDALYVRSRQEEIGKHIGHITKRLQRMIQARSYDRKIPGFRSGKLDGAALYRVPTGDDRVFRRVHRMTTKDVDVQLVVDLSGSMIGGKVELAVEVAYAFGLPLDRLGINNQIVGFTTKDMLTVTHHTEILKERHVGREPSRFEPIYMPILKDWNQSFTPDRQTAVIMAARDVDLWNNIDGESIEYAGRMLWNQKGTRKLMIVLSDGSPSAHGNRKEQAIHLRRVVRRLEAAGTEVFGIGIMDENVNRFYKNAVVITKLDEVLSTVMGVLENMLMRGAL